jgi:hypothetical protein
VIAVCLTLLYKLSDLNATVTNTQEHYQPSAVEQHKKCFLLSADVAEHLPTMKWPKAGGKGVETKLTSLSVIKTDTMVCVLYITLFHE